MSNPNNRHEWTSETRNALLILFEWILGMHSKNIEGLYYKGKYLSINPTLEWLDELKTKPYYNKLDRDGLNRLRVFYINRHKDVLNYYSQIL